MKTVLVTGGCGFIGSAFIRLLCADSGCRVVNLDKLTYAGNLENDTAVGDARYRFVHGDIGDCELVKRILQQETPWAVVNFAAESHVDRSILNSAPFIQSNITGVQVLLDAARRYPVSRFLQVSTDEVYGDTEGKPPSDEESPLMPSSPYAATKAAADLLCVSYRRTYGLPILITRSSNNYGPRQFPEKFIPLLIRNALSGMDLPVYGDGRQVRDWLYVDDNCQGILAVLEKGIPGSIYNIGAGNGLTNLQVAESVCRALAEQTSLKATTLKALIRWVADRPGHDRRYCLNTGKTNREIGWSHRTSFETGLKNTVRWYVDHQDWVSRVTSGEYCRYYESVYELGWDSPSKRP